MFLVRSNVLSYCQYIHWKAHTLPYDSKLKRVIESSAMFIWWRIIGMWSSMTNMVIVTEVSYFHVTKLDCLCCLFALYALFISFSFSFLLSLFFFLFIIFSCAYFLQYCLVLVQQLSLLFHQYYLFRYNVSSVDFNMMPNLVSANPNEFYLAVN